MSMISKTLLPDIIGLNSAFVVTSNHKSMREAIEILRYAQNDISRVVILNRSRVTLNEVKSLRVNPAKDLLAIAYDQPERSERICSRLLPVLSLFTARNPSSRTTP